jgi:hypothetical protein
MPSRSCSLIRRPRGGTCQAGDTRRADREPPRCQGGHLPDSAHPESWLAVGQTAENLAAPCPHRCCSTPSRPATTTRTTACDRSWGIGGHRAGLCAHRRWLHNRARLVEDNRPGFYQGSPGHAVVVAAQQQIDCMRAAKSGRDENLDDRPGRAAAGSVRRRRGPGPARTVIGQPCGRLGPAGWKPHPHDPLPVT